MVPETGAIVVDTQKDAPTLSPTHPLTHLHFLDSPSARATQAHAAHVRVCVSYSYSNMRAFAHMPIVRCFWLANLLTGSVGRAFFIIGAYVTYVCTCEARRKCVCATGGLWCSLLCRICHSQPPDLSGGRLSVYALPRVSFTLHAQSNIQSCHASRSTVVMHRLKNRMDSCRCAC